MSTRVDELERMVTRMYAEERERINRQLFWTGFTGFALGIGGLVLSIYTLVSMYLYGSFE